MTDSTMSAEKRPDEAGIYSSTTHKIRKHRNHCPSRAQWLTPIIPALWEAKADESPGQEIKTILVNMVKPHLYRKKKKKKERKKSLSLESIFKMVTDNPF